MGTILRISAYRDFSFCFFERHKVINPVRVQTQKARPEFLDKLASLRDNSDAFTSPQMGLPPWKQLFGSLAGVGGSGSGAAPRGFWLSNELLSENTHQRPRRVR